MKKSNKPTTIGKRGRKFHNVAEYKELAAMKPNSSKFYADKRPADLASVRRMCDKLKMKIVMRYTQEDPETQEAGTRMWCMTPANATVAKHVVENSAPDLDEDDEEI